ncbi:hypothetical protein FIV42_16450 [Persicimonas caeni]|uniref:Uncharacterized protein n=1 Tax=Persicimonas caeni TaxID=2292766 RepID=A0A4Y6PVK6_PERCE|nr:hypothetical protein [Persicimonas caeni]QDG52270.1 hypothetical protein FIV42_16450 [Persicimonas caeni]QED33492.1 hypothetical protein FRD00_16445 [Persicimonas caeni]
MTTATARQSAQGRDTTRASKPSLGMGAKTQRRKSSASQSRDPGADVRFAELPALYQRLIRQVGLPQTDATARALRAPGNNTVKTTVAKALAKNMFSGSGSESRSILDDIGGLAQDGLDMLSDVGSGIVEGVSNFGSWLGGLAQQGVDYLAETIVPGLVPFMKTIAEASPLNNPLVEAMCDGVADWVKARTEQWEGVDGIKPFFERMAKSAKAMTAAIDAMVEQSGKALGEAFRPYVEFLVEYINPWLDKMTEQVEKDQEESRRWWNDVASNVGDFIQGVWDSLKALAKPLWDLIGPAVKKVWGWIKDLFDLAVEGVTGLWNWLVEQAVALWKTVDEMLGLSAWIEKIQELGRILYPFTPLGMIQTLYDEFGVYWEQLKSWWSDLDFAAILKDSLDYITEEVLPQVLEMLRGVAGVLGSVLSTVSGALKGVIETIEGFMGKLGIEGCFRAIAIIFEWMAEQCRKVASWSDEFFEELVAAALDMIRAVAALLEPILSFLVKLLVVVSNPLLAPVVLTAAIWLLLPDDLKPPVIGFIARLCILAITSMPEGLLMAGPIQLFIKYAMLGFFEEIKRRADAAGKSGEAGKEAEELITMSNRAAHLLTGGGIAFIGGFLVGVLVGIVEGILDPIILIFEIIRIAVKAVAWLAKMFGSMLSPNGSPGASGAAAAAGASGFAGMQGATADSQAQQWPPQPSAATRAAVMQAAAENQSTGGDAQKLEETLRDADPPNPLERIMALLDSATAKIKGLAKSGGEKMLEGLFGLLSMSDWDLGYNFGKLVGMILLEVILIIVSMGGWGAVTAAKPFIKLAAKLLNKVDDVVLVIQKAFKPAKGLLMRGLDGAADFLSNIPGLGPIFARVQRAFKAMLRYGDEVPDAPPVGRGGAPAAARKPDVPSASKAPDAPSSGQKSKRPRRRPDAAEKQKALLEARAIEASFDAADRPVEQALAALQLLRKPYPWIKDFRAEAEAGDGRYSIWMIASKTRVGSYTERVEAHVAESRKAREASGFQKFAARESYVNTFSTEELAKLEGALGKGFWRDYSELGIRAEDVKKAVDKFGLSRVGEMRSEVLARSIKPPMSAGNWKNVSENQFVADYLSRYPKSTLSVGDIRKNYRAGQRLNPESGSLKVPAEFKGELPVEKAKFRPVGPNGETSRKFPIPESVKRKFEKILEDREKARRLRDLHKERGLDAEAKKYSWRVQRASEKLGELGTEAWIKDHALDWLKATGRVPADLDKLHSVKRIVGNPYEVGKPGEFDQIWEIVPRKGEPPIRVIPEAKGGAAGRGSRMGAGGFKRYEQGHPGYKDIVLEEMKGKSTKLLDSTDHLRKKQGRELRRVVRDLTRAEKQGQLAYLQIRAGFKKNRPARTLDEIEKGLLPELEIEIGEFDLTMME